MSENFEELFIVKYLQDRNTAIHTTLIVFKYYVNNNILLYSIMVHNNNKKLTCKQLSSFLPTALEIIYCRITDTSNYNKLFYPHEID